MDWQKELHQLLVDYHTNRISHSTVTIFIGQILSRNTQTIREKVEGMRKPWLENESSLSQPKDLLVYNQALYSVLSIEELKE